jgi:ATP-binding protein involved in chromosome partitioning
MFFPFRRQPDITQLAQQLRDHLTPLGANLEALQRINGRPVAEIQVTYGVPAEIEAAAQKFLQAQHIRDALVVVTAERAPAVAPGAAPSADKKPLPHLGAKYVVAVASGKGGVGKSTVATNLALALSDLGYGVGLLDADIYGPSIPMMMGITGQRPEQNDTKKLQPIKAHGIDVMSMGLLVDTEAPMIWRGPMVQSAILQMLRDVDWSGHDVLVIDLPPGTGDAQLTLAQKAHLTGAVIVTTPQDVARLDARKGLQMFRKVGVPVLGIVENMGLLCCPNCGHQIDVFGVGASANDAAALECPLLATLPLDPHIAAQGDAGVPIVRSNPEGTVAQIYRDLARQVSAGFKPVH